MLAQRGLGRLRQLPAFGKLPVARPATPVTSRIRTRLAPRRTLDYARIRREVLAVIAELGASEASRINPVGTLPEIMVALALIWLGYYFWGQVAELGGRLHVGGGVVDYIVWLGRQVIVRVQGDYWHSLPGRQLQDAVQWDRLHQRGYLVADLWEHDIYQAWVDGRLKEFVEAALLGAS